MAKLDKRPNEPSEIVRYWLAEISASRKREKDYRKEGADIRDIYAGKKKDTTPFNILFSNTETMLPSMYSQVPRPVVQRRYKDDDPLGKAAAVAGQRMLEFLLDTNVDGYETFHEALKAATMDGLLPGRGVTGIKYDADTSGDALQSELVCPETVSWDRVFFGYARKWSKVPWMAYEKYIEPQEGERLFGKEISSKIVYTSGESDDDGDDAESEEEDTENMGQRKTALVYQIWDKANGKKIRYISPQYVDGYLKEESDPLGLTGFFNCPRPLQFVEKTDDMIPTPLYTLYQNQATELNSLTIRIKKIIKAIKARGLYDGNLGDDIARLMEEDDDNVLVPAEKSASFAAEKGLQNAIWFMPLDVLIQTLRELYAARENCKQVIYEIMGISDILRGASKASETLGAQQIKNQWGSLRLKPKQAEVQRYARDILRMMLEIAATKFQEKTWAMMTGLPYLTQEQFQQAQMIAMQAAQQGNAQALEQLKQAMTWEQVLGMLKNDMQRAYKIDIETNSTVEPEAVEDQKNITEMMTAIGQFLNGVGPLVQQGIMPFQAAQGMLLAITRRFRFGTEIEDQIRAMQPPKPQDNGAEGKAAKQELAAKQREMQMGAENQTLKTQNEQLQATLEATKREMALAQRETQVQLGERDLTTDKQLFEIEKRATQESLTNKSVVENTKLDGKKQSLALESKVAKTEQNVSKAVDTKMGQSVTQLGGMIEKLVNAQGELLQAVAEQAKETQELVKVVKAPRKRKAVYGKDGRIAETVDEVMQ